MPAGQGASRQINLATIATDSSRHGAAEDCRGGEEDTTTNLIKAVVGDQTVVGIACVGLLTPVHVALVANILITGAPARVTAVNQTQSIHQRSPHESSLWSGLIGS